MDIPALFKSLCLPSKVYLVVTLIGVLLSFFFEPFNSISLFIQLIHFIYIIFWTWILNLICKAGYKIISWLLILVPFIAVFVYLFIFGDMELNDNRVASKTAPVIVLNK